MGSFDVPLDDERTQFDAFRVSAMVGQLPGEASLDRNRLTCAVSPKITAVESTPQPGVSSRRRSRADPVVQFAF